MRIASRARSWRRALGSAALLAVVAWMVDWPEFAAVVKRAHPGWIVLVLLVMHADRVFMAAKWRLLARGSGMSISTLTAVKSYYVGSFWGCVLPTSIGADVIRISWLGRRGADVGAVAGSVVVERALGALAQAAAGVAALGVLLVGSSGYVIATPLTTALVVFVAMTAILATTVLARWPYRLLVRLTMAMRWTRLQRLTASLARGIEASRRGSLLVTFLLLSLLQQALPVAANFCVANALSIPLSLSWLIVGIPIILAVTRAPLPLNDLGVKESLYALVLSFGGVSVTDAVAMSMVDRVLLVVAVLPGAFWTAGAPATPAVSGAAVPAAPPSIGAAK
jgi:uncharacterized protein (TIRG00374 family)